MEVVSEGVLGFTESEGSVACGDLGEGKELGGEEMAAEEQGEQGTNGGGHGHLEKKEVRGIKCRQKMEDLRMRLAALEQQCHLPLARALPHNIDAPLRLVSVVTFVLDVIAYLEMC
ncbi:hypothetical protein PIB30_080330 [Stylosanthes scabra]|uniref:Uncharacterized protein n=1 Tax=Stylosanthes scabra TaxID=79078 RepID=A0ABU6YQV5_9FABA|nr:hypothetical protein [Stylosanthes scabra]